MNIIVDVLNYILVYESNISIASSSGPQNWSHLLFESYALSHFAKKNIYIY